MSISPCKNDENGYLDREEDDQQSRFWYQIECCPAPHPCQRSCFKRANCWSYIHTDNVKAYLMNHLMFQGNHDMSAAEAEELANQTEIVENVESYEERERYRVQLEQQKERLAQQQVCQERLRSRSPQRTGRPKGRAWWGKGKGEGKGSGKGPRPPAVADVAGLSQVVMAWGRRMTHLESAIEQQNAGQGPCASSDGPTTAGSTTTLSLASGRSDQLMNGKIEVTMRDLMILRASLGRAYLAANKGSELLRHLANNYAAEATVIRNAREALGRLDPSLRADAEELNGL